jgi:hypothetical protein
MKIITGMHNEVSHRTRFGRHRIVDLGCVPFHRQLKLPIEIRITTKPFDQNIPNQLVHIEDFCTVRTLKKVVIPKGAVSVFVTKISNRLVITDMRKPWVWYLAFVTICRLYNIA